MERKPKSRLILGTAQLGMDYGINNRAGQPPKSEAFSMLDAAFSRGINTFDTAQAYGNAEEILGEWIKSRSLSGAVYVISKMKSHALNGAASRTEEVEVEIEKSLRRLQLDAMDGCLLHSPRDMDIPHIINGLRNAQKEGLVKHIGVSTYQEVDALRAVDLGFSYVQVPYNVFDQRLDATDFFERAEEHGTTVFARSPFLQGLMLMKPEDIPSHLATARPYVQRFIEVTARHQLSPLEASLLFVLSRPGIDHVVFGVDTRLQLGELCSIASRHADAGLSKSLMSELRDVPHEIPYGIVNPSLWQT